MLVEGPAKDGTTAGFTSDPSTSTGKVESAGAYNGLAAGANCGIEAMGAMSTKGVNSGLATGDNAGTLFVKLGVSGAALMMDPVNGVSAGDNSGFPMPPMVGKLSAGAAGFRLSVRGGNVRDERVSTIGITTGTARGPTAGASPTTGEITGEPNAAGANVDKSDGIPGTGGSGALPRSKGRKFGISEGTNVGTTDGVIDGIFVGAVGT